MAQAIAHQLYQRLSEQGRLTSTELEELWQSETVEPLTQPLDSEWDLASWLGRAAGCEALDLREVKFQKSALRLVPARVARAVQVLPIYTEDDGKTVVIATYDPLDVIAIDRVRRACKLDVRIVCAARSQLLRYLEIYYGSEEEAVVEKLLSRSKDHVVARNRMREQKKGMLFAEYEQDLGRTPVEQLVDAIVGHAVARRATDIHITCHPDKVVLKHRVDGMLRDVFAIPREIHRSLVTRLKLASGMDITSKHLPQDGNMQIKVKEAEIQVRSSVFPTIYGEDIGLRLLYQSMYQKDLSALGFVDWKLRLFEQLLDMPKGLVLVTGPVGVGKTTTLYASLNRIEEQDRRIITLEDPVECRLKNIVQSQVHPATGYDFAAGLRSVLRMDPDVLMVGEIRDVETARMSLRASLTGIMVLATLHTDRAAGAMPRLLDMEVEPYLLTSSLQGVLAQGLVRTICPDCRDEHKPSPALLHAHDLPEELLEETFWKGSGCDRCEYTGYLGRTGIFELLVVDDTVRDLIVSHGSRLQIEQAARKRGMQTMIEDGLDKARQGITTFEDVLRVTSGR